LPKKITASCRLEHIANKETKIFIETNINYPQISPKYNRCRGGGGGEREGTVREYNIRPHWNENYK
jgi:hypothetical protein